MEIILIELGIDMNISNAKKGLNINLNVSQNNPNKHNNQPDNECKHDTLVLLSTDWPVNPLHFTSVLHHVTMH